MLCTRPAERAAAHFRPEQLRDLIANQAVKYAARLLRVDQVHVDNARMGEGVSDGAIGDLMEDDPLDVDLAISAAATKCQAIASPSRSGSVAR